MFGRVRLCYQTRRLAMALLRILIVVGIAFLVVGYYCLKGWDIRDKRLGVKFTIIGFICLGIGILGNLAIPIIEFMHNSSIK